jgi:hypothetical protein
VEGVSIKVTYPKETKIKSVFIGKVENVIKEFNARTFILAQEDAISPIVLV